MNAEMRRRKKKDAMDFRFHGFWRMDWGFQNPNKTATLIAALMFGVWGAAFLWRHGYWIALSLFTGLGVLLVHTFSRGGIVAFLTGAIVLLTWAPLPWARSRLIGSIVCLWLMIGATVYLQANQRITQGMGDRSIANRIEIWRTVPRMIADAPMGWGVGNAVGAYQNWYQALDRSETYLNLVSSHFDWMVEFNWWQRILYCFGWFAVGLLCWPAGKRTAFRWFSVPLSIWVSFFVSGIFSHVAESLWLWVLPVIALLAALVFRWRHNTWPGRQAWIGGMAASIVIVGTVTAWGMMAPDFHVEGSRHLVKIGNGEVRIWIVRNTGAMGDHYGKALRRYMEDHPPAVAVGIVDSVKSLPAGHQGMVVVAGEVSESERPLLHTEGRLLLLNPVFFPQETGVGPAQLAGVFFGEFSQSPSIQAWRSIDSVKTMAGVGDFIASWPEFVFNSDAVSVNE